jgi:putative membrane protein insertion efficiency factor
MLPSPALKRTTARFSTSATARGPRILDRLGVDGALGLLRAYKLLVSPLFAGSCRFQPSCSDYMAEAIQRHGLIAGSWLGVKRLSRCRPLGGHGIDPVPHQ